ncbi:MAG: AAA family ATPase [Thermoguttaceae bacterium]
MEFITTQTDAFGLLTFDVADLQRRMRMLKNRPFLERLKLSGYKSIREAELEFTKLNVLIGANGAGKSNLVSFFSLLPAALDEKLDAYVGRHGGPNALLYFAAQRTSEIAVAATVRTIKGTGILSQRLGFRAPDTLYYGSHHSGAPYRAGEAFEMIINDVCALVMKAGGGPPDETIYYGLKDGVATYHLVDTSLTSPIRTEGYVEDNKRLNSNGSNLAAVLFRYKRSNEEVYRRIRSTVRKIVPSFDDFVLEPRELNPRNILLNWRQLGQDYLFGPHQLSDGALRAIALITLFQQPEDELPNLIVVDEPELGLHPHAMLIISGLMRAASSHTQVLLATQSPTFLDNFNPDEVIVAEEKEQASHYRRVTPDELREWLQEYSLGELWQKNVLGGGPMP